MKKTIYSLCGILMSLSLCFTSKANTNPNVTTAANTVVNTVCFNDGYYNWKITYTGESGSYTALGTVNVDGVDWSVYGSGDFAHHAGSVELHAANPYADGCNSGYVDSFTYYGTAEISGNGGNTTFYGSGNWENYCSGSLYNTGSWSAYGPCSSSLKKVTNGPANHNISADKKSSNTVCFNDGFYNWKITYTNQGGGNYTCTGSLNVDGVNWNVYGYGDFSHKDGYVEFHASNPYPDGCTFYVDSFTYYGNATISGSGSGTTFYGSGSWTNYCYGSELTYGSWSAYGPCSSSLKSLPYGPAKHSDIFSMKVSPNPMKSSSAITYNLIKDAKVNITVYNSMQQPLKVIANGNVSAGKHTAVIDGSSLTSGVYRIVAIVDGKSYSTNLQVAR